MKSKYKKYKDGGPVTPKKKLQEQVDAAVSFYDYYFNSPKFKERAKNLGVNPDYVSKDYMSRLGGYEFIPRFNKTLTKYDEKTGKEVPVEEKDLNYVLSAYEPDTWGDVDKLYYKAQTAADIEPGVREMGTLKDREAIAVHELGHDIMNPYIIDFGGSTKATNRNRNLFSDLMFSDAHKFGKEKGFFGKEYTTEDLKALQNTDVFKAMLSAKYGGDIPVKFDAQSQRPNVDYNQVYDNRYEKDMNYIRSKSSFDGGELPSGSYMDEHDGPADEMIPDIYSIRYLLNKYGLYDAGKEDFTQEVLDKMQSDPRLKDEMLIRRLRENIENVNKTNSKEQNDKIFIEMMNKIAANSTKQKGSYA